MDKHPQKPRLVLRVGVSGHRPDNFPAAAQAVVLQRLEELFAQLHGRLEALRLANGRVFDGATAELRIVSALAEGADRVVAEAGLHAGALLDVVLPFPAEVYETDFQTAESKRQFHDLLAVAHGCLALDGVKSQADPEEEKRAYEAAGLVALRQCDLLITVWNGREAAGRGGTERILQHAASIGRPILRFDSNGEGPFLFDRDRPAPANANDLVLNAPLLDAAMLDRLVQQLCAPPGERAGQEGHQAAAERMARRRLQRFLDERERRFALPALAYPLMVCLFAWKKWSWANLRFPPYLASTAEEWKGYWAPLTAAGDRICDPLRRVLMARFAWADKLANFYGQFHRSGYVTNYSFAALAVLCATAAALLKDQSPGSFAHYCEIAELLLIVSVVATTVFGWLCSWHPRWLEYRQLSTLLRHQRALFLTGSSTWDARTPHADEVLQPGTIWVNWYYRMTLRELGLVAARVDGQYLSTVRQAIGEGEVRDQVGYHERNQRRMRWVGRWLDIIGIASFGLTFVACLFEVMGDDTVWMVFPHLDMRWLHGISVILPAVGAATFGIRIQGDFEGSAERSDRMKRSLGAIADRMLSPSQLSFAELSALTENAIATMAEEIDDWGFVYRARPLGLPT